VSALTGEGVNNMFYEIVGEVNEQYKLKNKREFAEATSHQIFEPCSSQNLHTDEMKSPRN
jgi:hypothetical protein